MKHIKFAYILFILGLVISSGCESVLDTEAKDAFAEDLIYNSPAQVERLVYSNYNCTDGWAIDRANWWGRHFGIDGASYEGKFNFLDKDLYMVRGAGWTASNSGLFKNKWTEGFYYVRKCNEFLDRIDDSGAMKEDAEKVKMLKAEVRFLRAYSYAKLINYFGGVPIMEHALGLNDDFNLVRDSYEDCVKWIVAELDDAMLDLPASRPDAELGRATSLAAMAVKSRVLLYAASSLHDPANVPAENSELYSYSVSTKWEDAAAAAKAIIDVVGGRDLIATADAKAYQELFLKPNEDMIFVRPYSSAYYEFGTDVNTLPDMTQSPNGYGGWALISPSHNFAQEFAMADGAVYDETKPNDNREMRYYANLLYNGADFRGRDVQYYLGQDSTVTPGKDSPEGLGNTKHSSKTGYNIRKFQDESLASLTDISAERPKVLYRLAEVYLNYAEAKCHIPGGEDEARTYVSKVTTRALQPAVTATGDALLEAVKRERRVELCFEGHNFFDERRWMNEAHLGFPLEGLKWTKNTDGSMTFVKETVVTRTWDAKRYYVPVPSSEVEKAPSILQNYGY